MHKFSVYSIIFVSAAVCSLGSACQVRNFATPTATAESSPTPVPAIGDSITIAAVGDIMLGSTSINDTFLPPNDGRDMLAEVAPILSAADIAFGNLEGPLIDGGISAKCPEVKPVEPIDPKAPPKPVRCFAFRVPARYGKHLKDAGFDVLSLANNHAFDFGDEGRITTRKTLDAFGIKHAGSDKTRYSTTILESKGKKIAFVGFAHNAIAPNVNELTAARQFVSAAAAKSDIVVVSFHGGAEGMAAERVPKVTEMFFGEKRGNLPLFARTVIDAGADLVLGHGPHVLRGMEVYKDRLVVYSMGNFATYGMFNLKGALGLTAIFEIELASDGAFAGGKIHSGKQIGRGIPVLDKSGEAVRKLRTLSQSNFAASAPKIDEDGRISSR